jgi:hypothetical protein
LELGKLPERNGIKPHSKDDLVFTWIPLILGFIYQFVRGRNMQKQVVFLVDIGKWVGTIALLVVLGCWAERTPVVSTPPPAKPEPEKPNQRKKLFPIIKGELDDLQPEAPGDRIQLGDTHPPDGTKVQIDFPLERDMRNIGSKVDGKGMCVMTSAERAADWSGLDELKGIRDYAAKDPGGCYPEKFDSQVKRYCKAKGIDIPNYLFYLGRDQTILELALRSGRMPAISYSGRDGVQYKGPIAHVTNLVHFNNGWAGVYDNNYDAHKRIWLPEKEFLARWADGRSLGWAIVWLDPPPPPKLVE